MLFTGNAIFTSIAVGAMLMVAVALIGSLSILPALLSKLGHRVDKGRIPFLGAPQRRRVAGLGLRPRPRPAPAAAVGGALGRRAARARRPGAHAAHPAAELHRPAAVAADRPHLRVDPARLPGRPDAGRGRRRRRRRDRPAGAARRSPSCSGGRSRRGQMFEPISTRINPARTVERCSISLQGNGERRASVAALQTLRDRVIPATLGRSRASTPRSRARRRAHTTSTSR